MPDTHDLSEIDAYAIWEEANDLVLKPDNTADDRKLAFALVDGLKDKNLSAKIRRTSADWNGENPMAGQSVPNDPLDVISYDYDDEDLDPMPSAQDVEQEDDE
jgi:hypothetical protein